MFCSIRARRFRCGGILPVTRLKPHSSWVWGRLSNGDLLVAAEGRFDVLVTTDRNLRHQQSLAGRKLAVLILPTTSWPRLESEVDKIASSLASITPGLFLELQF